jgi:integrase
MSIYPYPDGKGRKRYRVQVDMGRRLDGKRDRRTVVVSTKKEAAAAERRLMMERDGLGGRSNRITFADFVSEWYLPMKEKTLRRNTLAGYRRDIRLMMPIIGHRMIGDIDRYTIQQMLLGCRTRKVAENTRDTLRAILSEAVQLDLLTRNLAAGRYSMPDATGTAGKAKPEPWVTDFTEHRRIIEAAVADGDAEAERLLVLGLCFGLRKGEILGMDWQSIDLDSGVLHVTQTYTNSEGQSDLTPPKTEASHRSIPLTPYATSALLRLIGGISRIGAVNSKHGRRMSPARAKSVLSAFFKRHPELPRLTCSSMRHSFATSAILGGVNVATVSRWLGHTDITTTLNRYVKPMQTDMEQAAKQIQALYYGT